MEPLKHTGSKVSITGTSSVVRPPSPNLRAHDSVSLLDICGTIQCIVSLPMQSIEYDKRTNLLVLRDGRDYRNENGGINGRLTVS